MAQQDMAAVLAVLKAAGIDLPVQSVAPVAAGTCPGYDGEACGAPSDARSKKKGYCGRHFTEAQAGYLVSQWRRLDESARTIALTRMQHEAAEGIAPKPSKRKAKDQETGGVDPAQVSPEALAAAIAALAGGTK